MSRRSPFVALVVLALTAGACGAADDEAVDDVADVPVGTIAGVGSLPDTIPSGRQQRILIPGAVNADGSAAGPIGEFAQGNRVLIIGDSIMASTSSRYGDQMCDELVPLGWQVAVEAEPSRFVEFGNSVLDRVLDDEPAAEDDWHAAVVFLGSNYDGDPFAYANELGEILDRLAPRPTVLFTVTEYRSNYAEVNDVVRRFAEEYGNVTLLDWQAIAEEPGVLSGDRLHPSELGRNVLAQAVAAVLGPVSIGDGDCLRSTFRDDSADNGGSGGGSSLGSSGGSSNRSSGSGGSSSSGGSTEGSETATTTTVAGDGGSGGSDGGTPSTTLPGAPTPEPSPDPPANPDQPAPPPTTPTTAA